MSKDRKEILRVSPTKLGERRDMYIISKERMEKEIQGKFEKYIKVNVV